MKISEMIKALEHMKNIHGDLNCWAASDDEGNNYNQCNHKPSLMFRFLDDDCYELRDVEELEEIKQELADDEDSEPLNFEYVICVN